MSSHDPNNPKAPDDSCGPPENEPARPEVEHRSIAETQLAPPIRAARPSVWKSILFALKAIEIRLRFVAVLVGIGLVIGYWDTIKNYWDKWTRPAEIAGGSLAGNEQFYCPMHPSVVRDKPDAGGAIPKCPICGMPLSKRKKGESAALPPGVISRVQLSPYRIQLAGIQTVEIEARPLTKELRAVGYVAYDDSRLSRIVVRASGYLEKLYVNQSFTQVTAGEPLAEIYSPELYSAVQEYLIASRNERLGLKDSAREKLRLLGVADEEIEQIEKSGKSNTRLVIRAPRSGHVFRKEAVEGDHVDAGQMLFEVADLSAVWIETDVYERDVALIYPGQKVTATVDGLPDKVFTGTVGLIHPHVDPTTRTNRVRFEVENPGHLLRPGMYATVHLETPVGQLEPFRSRAGAPKDNSVLAVPQQAVIDTGEQKIVYLERTPGVFEGLEVKLGPRAGGYYAVIEGLLPGDRVAAAGSFLVDAETRLNPSAAAAFFGASGTPKDSTSPEKSKSSSPGSSPGSSPKSQPLPTAAAKQPTAENLANVAKLPEADRPLALAQKFCAFKKGEPLGSMGVPVKITVEGETVFLCCSGCEDAARRNAEQTLTSVHELRGEQPQK